MRALRVHIRLLEPVLVTQPMSGEENSSITYDFIPGSVLRGAAIRAYLTQAGRAELNLQEDADAHRLFFRGGLRFLNAYPAHPQTGERSLPCPLSWLARKDDVSAGLPKNNRFLDLVDFAVGASDLGQAPKPPKKNYWWPDDKQVQLYAPRTQNTVHNSSVERNAKRVINSTVYRYVALAVGEEFAGMVLADHEADMNTLMVALKDNVMVLGGSHTAGYGRVELTLSEVSQWTEYLEDKTVTNTVTITLLSDAILRSRDGQGTLDFDQAVADALNIAKPRHERAYQQTALVGGFNRKWGLPLPQMWALRAGSAFVYSAKALQADTVRPLMAQGLGERCEEGFGRFAINLKTQAKFTGGEAPQRQAQPATSLSSASRQLAQRMAERRLRVLLDQHLAATLNNLNLSRPPKKTQLSRLRVTAQRARATGNLNLIRDHLNSLKGSRVQFERARLGDQRLWDWLEQRLGQANLLMDLGLGEAPSIAGQRAAVTEPLKVEYTARLIDGVLRRAIKQQQAEGRK